MLTLGTNDFGLDPNIPVINDSNYLEHTCPVINGEVKRFGLKPRDFKANPVGSFKFAPAYPTNKIMSGDEMQAAFEVQKRDKSSLLDLRKQYGIHSLDQDGYGYCWAFSSTKALMYARVKMGEPYEELSAWAVASIIKKGRNEGGWGSESLEWIVANGCPTLKVWPQGRVDYKTLDTPAMRADAATRKITEWWDGAEDRDTIKLQMLSSFLRSEPCVCDFNWWSHSVCGIAVISLNPLKVVIDNSWSDDAGDHGLYVLEGSKAIPDGLWVPNVATAA